MYVEVIGKDFVYMNHNVVIRPKAGILSRILLTLRDQPL